MSADGYETVAKVGEIIEGEGRRFLIRGRSVALFLSQGRYFAIDDVCPHQGLPLHDGIVEESSVTCLAHDWRFDLATGSWAEDRRICVETFSVRLVDDEIQVAVIPPTN